LPFISILAIFLHLLVCLRVIIPEINHDGIRLRTGVETTAAPYTPFSCVFSVVIALGIQPRREHQNLLGAFGYTKPAPLAFVRVHL